jgi:predicted Na+-dependent transporter
MTVILCVLVIFFQAYMDEEEGAGPQFKLFLVAVIIYNLIGVVFTLMAKRHLMYFFVNFPEISL